MIDIYLACPFTHINTRIRIERYIKASIATGNIILEGYTVYSPLSHNVTINYAFKNGLFHASSVDEHTAWMEYNLKMLKECRRLYVLMLAGFGTSIGVNMEIEEAAKNDKPIIYISEEDYCFKQYRELKEFFAIPIE